MSTLIERATVMVPEMEWIKDAQNQVEQTKALEEVGTYLNGYREEVQSIAQRVKALSQSGVLLDGFLSPHLQAVRERIPSLHERLTSAPGDIKRRNFWANTQQVLASSVEKLRGELLKLWQDHLDELCPPLNEIQDLIRSDIFGEDLRRIGQLQNEIDLARGALPCSIEQIQSVSKKSQELRELVAKLDFNEIPPNVKRFLSAVLLGNFNLSELKSDVLAWLVEKNIAKGFRITSVRTR